METGCSPVNRFKSNLVGNLLGRGFFFKKTFFVSSTLIKNISCKRSLESNETPYYRAIILMSTHNMFYGEINNIINYLIATKCAHLIFSTGFLMTRLVLYWIHVKIIIIVTLKGVSECRFKELHFRLISHSLKLSRRTSQENLSSGFMTRLDTNRSASSQCFRGYNERLKMLNVESRYYRLLKAMLLIKLHG